MSLADEHPFLAEAAADPENDFPRLVYADWLDERGDPRGEVIRLQCAAAQLDAGDPEREALLRTEGIFRADADARWRELLADVTSWPVRLTRGLPHTFDAPANSFARDGARVLDAVPTLTCWNMSSFPDTFLNLRRSPKMQKLIAGELFGRLTGWELPWVYFRLRDFLDIDKPAHLRELKLRRSGITTADVEFITRSPFLSELRALDLSYNALAPGALNSLAESEHLTHLESLNLHGCRVSETGPLTTWFRSSNTATLRSLWLGQTEMHDPAAVALAESDTLPELRALRLSSNDLSDTTAEAFYRTQTLPSLRFLNIRGNRISRAWRHRLAERYWT